MHTYKHAYIHTYPISIFDINFLGNSDRIGYKSTENCFKLESITEIGCP